MSDHFDISLRMARHCDTLRMLAWLNGMPMSALARTLLLEQMQAAPEFPDSRSPK